MHALIEGDQPRAVLGQSLELRHRLVKVRRWHLNETGDRIFDRITLEYNGFAGQGDEPASAERRFAWLLAHLPDMDELVARNATAETGAALRAAAMASGWKVRQTNVAPAPTLDLQTVRAADGEFIATLGKNTRAAIRRATRLYEEIGPIRLERAETVADALAWFERLEALHIESWQDRSAVHAFSNPYFRPFHQHLIQAGYAQGRVDMLRIRAGNREIGYLYNLVCGGRVMAYQSGFAAATDNRWKPGLVSHCAAIDFCLRRGDRIYDFLAGPARYKVSLANGETPMESLVAFAPRWHLRLEDMLRQLRS